MTKACAMALIESDISEIQITLFVLFIRNRKGQYSRITKQISKSLTQ